MKISAIPQFAEAGGNFTNIIVVNGTSINEAGFDKEIAPGQQFFSGEIRNLSTEQIGIGVTNDVGLQGGIIRGQLKANEALILRSFPIKRLQIFATTDVRVRVIGVLIDPESASERAVLFANASVETREALPDWDVFDHTDITTNTTTVIADPATDRTMRAYKVTIATDSTVRVVLAFRDSAGANNRIIGQINFTGEGSFVFDFGDRGIPNPHGAEGDLVAITTNIGGNLDIDVVSRDE